MKVDFNYGMQPMQSENYCQWSLVYGVKCTIGHILHTVLGSLPKAQAHGRISWFRHTRTCAANILCV